MNKIDKQLDRLGKMGITAHYNPDHPLTLQVYINICMPLEVMELEEMTDEQVKAYTKAKYLAFGEELFQGE